MLSVDTNSPIFLVGVPRSGTTLLAAFLDAHSRLGCGAETDYFHFLAQTDQTSLFAEDIWPNSGMKFLFEVFPSRETRPLPDCYELTRSEIRSFLLKHHPSPDIMLRAVVEQSALRAGKHRWVEKTPRHLLHLKAISSCFPDAKIVRIIRDPRDVALSTLETWSWPPRTLEGAVLMWKYFDDHSRRFFAQQRNVYTLKYEDLVINPESELRKLCAFLGEQFESQMLKRDNPRSNVNILKEPWKEKAAESLDQSRVEVWKRKLDSSQRQIVFSLIGDRLLEYGYPCESRGAKLITVYPGESPLLYPSLCDWLIERGARVWSRKRSDQPVAHALVGDPNRDNWFGHSRGQRLVRMLRCVYTIISRRCRGVCIYWHAPDHEMRPGILGGIVLAVLKHVGHVVNAGRRDDSALQWRIDLTTHPQMRKTAGQWSNATDRSDRRRLTG